MKVDVRPNTMRVTVVGSKRFPPETFETRDPDFPWLAECGRVQAIGRTRTGAEGLAARIAAGSTAEDTG